MGEIDHDGPHAFVASCNVFVLCRAWRWQRPSVLRASHH
jgi:hypothetical protein